MRKPNIRTKIKWSAKIGLADSPSAEEIATI